MLIEICNRRHKKTTFSDAVFWRFDSLPTSVVHRLPLQTFWDADGIHENVFETVEFEKKQQTTKKREKLPSMQRVNILLYLYIDRKTSYSFSP